MAGIQYECPLLRNDDLIGVRCDSSIKYNSIIVLNEADHRYLSHIDEIHPGELLPIFSGIDPNRHNEFTVEIESSGKSVTYNGQTYFNTTLLVTDQKIKFGAIHLPIKDLRIRIYHGRRFI